MALTLKGIRKVRTEPYKELLVDVAWDDSYAEGGEAIAAADVGLSVIDRIDDSIHASTASGYLCRYNGSALVLYQGDARTGETTLTDSTGGVASATLAATVGVYVLPIVLPPLADFGTSAIDLVTDIVPGHAFKILSWEAITTTAGAGASASQVLNLAIGTVGGAAVDVGTTPSTLTLTEASTSAVGERTAATAVSGANTGTSAQSITVELAASGTVFSAGVATLYVKIQNMDTANAFASLAAMHTIVAGLLDDNGTLAPVAAETDLATVPVTGTIRVYGR